MPHISFQKEADDRASAGELKLRRAESMMEFARSMAIDPGLTP
jgi:hypothetical protein